MFELSLLFILTFITFIDAYKSRVVLFVLKFIPQDLAIDVKTEGINYLKQEVKQVSMYNEFAKHVKLCRKLKVLMNERKELVKKQAFKTMKIRYALMTAFYIIIYSILVSLMWFYRSEPVIKVPAHWLWPVSSFFNWCNSVPGSVTVPCWVAISSSASKSFANHF